VATRWHRLRISAERYQILSGTGLVEVGAKLRETVGPEDTVLIPPGYRQRITCTGEEDLVFLAICSPPFQPNDYEDAELAG